jgi:ABC-2 type transport system ATP-binding protein
MNELTPNPVVRVRGLSRSFGRRQALCNVSIEVDAGQVHVLLGHNGAGKTTLFRILLGLIKPTAGTAEILGFDTWKARDGILARRHTGALFEANALYEGLTALENLELFARIYQMNRDCWLKQVESLLTGVDLFDRRYEKVVRWSAGMKRKLSIIRAVQHAPRLVILDEPTAGLDAVSRAKIRECILDFRSKDSAVMIASQDLAEAERVATHVTLLRLGALLYSGTFSGLYAKASLKRFHGSPQAVSEFILSHPCEMELLREERDIVGAAALVRVSQPNMTQGHAFKGLVETPVSLEDIYLEIDQRAKSSYVE